MDEFAWASAVGRVRILEKGLLPRGSFLALSETPDLRAALNMLRDSPYGPYLSHAGNGEGYEKALEIVLKDEFRTIYDMAPEPEIVAAFRGRYDFHNLKVLEKAKLLNVEPEEEAKSLLGMVDDGDLVKMISHNVDAKRVSSDQDQLGRPEAGEDPDEDSKGNAFLLEALSRAHEEQEFLQDMAERGKSENDDSTLWLLIDSFADRCYYEMVGTIYRRAGYEGLLEFYQSEVDMVNLKMFLRAKRQNISQDVYREIALSGGTVDKNRLEEAYQAGLSQLVQAYRGTLWEKLASLGVSLMEEGKSLTSWEKECDNTHIATARRFKTYPLGPEPAVGYMFGKEVEVRNLRIVLTGKEAMISAKEISERLRDTYA